MLNLILSVFFIPLIIVINSFLIGKLIRRYAISVNSYMATVMGFFAYIAILFIFFSLLYTCSAVILVYLIFFITLQGILLCLYIWNFRYIFTTWSIQIKSCILFVSTLLVTIGILTIIILLAYQTQPVSNQMTNIIGKFNGNFKQYKNSLIFYDDNFSFKNFSIFVVFAAIFRPFFNVGDPYVTRYLFWQQVITFGIIFSCTITGFFYQRINLCNYLLIPFILIVTLITLTFSFMFFESPIIGCSWIAIPIILYCYQTFQRPYRDDRLINNVLLVMVIGFTALDVDLTLITILLFLFNFCYSSMKNLNPVGQFLYCFFPFLYVFFLWMPLSSPVPYVILLTIWLIGSLIMVALYFWHIFRKIIFNINQLAYRHPLSIVVVISLIIYSLSFFFFITIFNYHFSWRLWPENYNYVWGIILKNHPNFDLFLNIGSWITLGVILTVAITISIIKKMRFSSQPYLFLILMMILLFINPLTLNLFLKITEQNHFDLLDLGLVNFLVIVPLALWFGNVLSAKQLFAMKEAAHV